MKMWNVKRNDRRSLNAWVKDNFGRAVNLQGADIKFVMRSQDDVMGPDGEKVVVATQEAIEIYDQLKYGNAGQFNLLLDEEATECSGKYRAEFQISLKGIAQNRKTPEYELEDEQTLVLNVDGEEQTITFDANDFSKISEATAQEVVDVLNDQLEGATAHVVQVNLCDSYIMILSSAVNGSIQMIGGSAIDALGFDNLLHRDQKITLPSETLLVIIKDDLDEKEVID